MKNLRKEQTQLFGRGVAESAIKLYQRVFSPDAGILRSSIHAAAFAAPNAGCRFFPSCSEYALQAIRQYGLFSGGVISLRRIISCNPFSRGGYDPVPSPDNSAREHSETQGV